MIASFFTLSAQAAPQVDWSKCEAICNVLVIYGADHGAKAIDPKVPHYVVKNWSTLDPKNEVLLSDIVPYATLVTKEQLQEPLVKALIKHKDNTALTTELKKIMTWLSKNIKDGADMSYVLEPLAIAGNGTAHVLRDQYMTDQQKNKEVKARAP